MLSIPPAAQELCTGARRLRRSVHIKGADWALPFVLTLGAVIATWYFFCDGIAGPFLLYLAILPVCAVLCGLRFGHEKDISVGLMCEMLMTGALVSIGIATALEGISQQLTMPIWKCQKSTIFTWQCDVMFGIVVTLCVGLAEEFAKFFPLSRLRRRLRYIPYVSHEWWYRLVETPYAFTLGGCASAAGFACVENIKYIILTGRKDLQHGIDTSLFRAVLAIPFHIACTGWAAARLCRELYFVPTDIPPPQTTGWLRQCLLRGDAHSGQSSDDYHAVANPSMVYSGVSLWQYLRILTIPVLLHGLYDTGLFLASQFMTVADRSDQEGDKETDEFYKGLAAVSIVCSLASYTIMIWLFVREYFYKLHKFQAQAVPRLHHNYDCA
eukprot:Gregarina_sp_Pseudo_9__263@NODE_1169_length_1815_cov_20_818131_g1095_i0_p1_GENE_NODE_1169_length_1815_cov_20_818131_g1095_i0NODE_1169_length_1815_cov_20_818131_g1095_i0_p1_ORF_typecomplete_len383_score61_86PrsWprotease/PF13367_6/3_5e03PrsWprotease/PF13367_6/4_7e28_NODE_1169_length_1815_cov_20_818131_g1095_i05791727